MRMCSTLERWPNGQGCIHRGINCVIEVCLSTFGPSRRSNGTNEVE